ncbi:spore coat protein U domain-containing protein, partial [Herbaspirillum sp. YR522]|uniref:spore coat protein U domain-containing protein n=2 Tax=unclassified Herbaspirillum TaxID=2624150 RepID=UPI00026FC557
MFAKNNRIVAASIAAIVLATSAPQSFAATATGSLTISANVVAACTVVGSAIAFGAYTQAVVNQTGGITVLCTNGT